MSIIIIFILQASLFLRELLIPFGSAGYVALFEIEGGDLVTVLAVRHQREDDYYQSGQRLLLVLGAHPLCGFSIVRKGPVD